MDKDMTGIPSSAANRIRRGLEASIIAVLLLIVVLIMLAAVAGIAIASLAFMILAETGGTASETVVDNAQYIGRALLGSGIAVLAGIYLAVLYGHWEIMRGSSLLASATGHFDIGYLGARLAFYGSLLTTIGIPLALMLVGLPVLALGVVMISAGGILWGLDMALLGLRTRRSLVLPGLLAGFGSLLLLNPVTLMPGMLLWLIGGYMLRERL